MINPRKFDPSQTVGLRRAYGVDLTRRLSSVESSVKAVIGSDGASAGFGLPSPLTGNVGPWGWLTDSQKVKAFRTWLLQQVEQKLLLPTDHRGRPWYAKHVESAYQKGVLRGYDQVRKRNQLRSGESQSARKSEFLQAFTLPVEVEKLQLIFTRDFSLIKGLTDEMQKQLSIELTTGLSRGENPRKIAARLVKKIQGLKKNRALKIARTEIVYAHAEGQLRAFKRLGIEEVGVLVEWLTAGDDKVCPFCHAMEGEVFTLAEASGMIPLHPSCRCAWVPSFAPRKGGKKRPLAENHRRLRALTPIYY